MFEVTRKEMTRIVPLVMLSIAIVTGAFVVGTTAVEQMQRAHVEFVADSYVELLADQAPEVGDIATGNVSADEARQTIDALPEFGTVFRVQFFDQSGHLHFDSALEDGGYAGFMMRPYSERAASQILIEDANDYHRYDGDGEMRPKHYASVLAPLNIDGQVQGVVRIFSDESKTWPALLAQVNDVFIKIALLIAIAFAVPGYLYLRRSGQLEFTSSRLRHTAEYDELTGMLNRSTFTRLMEEQLHKNGEEDQKVAVHFIDLDRFKDVNDTRGHAVGDEVLRLASDRLRRLLGTRERIARLGGDEFAIFQPYYAHNAQVVEVLANDIVKEMAKLFFVGQDEIKIGASVGYSHYPQDGETVPELVRAADIALYKAKQANRGCALAFDSSMETERQTRQLIENRLRTALTQGEFEIHYQPLFTVSGDKLRGFEALLRLSDHDGKPISPAVFIPVAEEIGLIGDIGIWVLREACRTAKQWPEDLVVSVNLSPAQFVAYSMSAVVQDTLDWCGIDPARLELEVTESLLIADTDKVLSELRAIKELGVSIALDDFGTGYSSLSYLWQFPFDKLKVDKSFMTDLAVTGSKSREILSAIIALGRVLDLKITAEGVETEEQAEVLRELDCDLVQGFLFGRPMRAIDVAATVLEAFKDQKKNKKPARIKTPERGAA